jgi:hypothetical protein
VSPEAAALYGGKKISGREKTLLGGVAQGLGVERRNFQSFLFDDFG